jgi:hypothetical protein
VIQQATLIGRGWGLLAAGLLLIWEIYEPEEMQNHVEFLSRSLLTAPVTSHEIGQVNPAVAASAESPGLCKPGANGSEGRSIDCNAWPSHLRNPQRALW